MSLRSRGFPSVFFVLLLAWMGCTPSSYSPPEFYYPPEILVPSWTKVDTPNPGAAPVLVNERKKRVAVDSGSDHGRWVFLSLDFKNIKYSQNLLGSPGSDSGYYSPELYQINIKKDGSYLPNSDWSLRTSGRLVDRTVVYYTGGYNILPGTRHTRRMEVFSGLVELLYKNNAILRQHVVNQSVTDGLLIGINAEVGIVSFMYSKNAYHHIEAIYLLHLPDLLAAKSTPLPGKRLGGGAESNP